MLERLKKAREMIGRANAVLDTLEGRDQPAAAATAAEAPGKV
jgi:hypothetical protein